MSRAMSRRSRPPGASPNHKLVTHRIYRILPGPNGQRAFVTKGDANERPDAWKFVLQKPTQDVALSYLPSGPRKPRCC